MSRIRSKNTTIEKRAFSYLRSRKIYFQKHYKKAPGSPDLALPRKKKAVFIDGDFWHGYRFNSFRERLPDFWKKKIERNIKRDRKNRAALRKSGWEVLRIWEHEIEKDFEKTMDKITKFLKK